MDIFEKVSGQLINKRKTCFMMGKFMKQKAEDIQVLTGYQHTELPVQYLGIPLYKGRTIVSLFDNLVRRLVHKVEGWKAKFLTASGKLVQIKAVLSSVPIHLLSVLQPPKKIIDLIQQKIQSFLWDTTQEKRHQWINGKRMRSYTSGGLKVEDL